MLISRLSRHLRGMQGALLLVTVSLLFIFILLIVQQKFRLDEEIASRQRLEQLLAKLQLADGVSDQQAPSNDPLLSSVFDDVVVIYNRVPKTASTSFANIAYSLCGRNHFNVLHLNITRNNHVLSVPDQMRFVFNVTLWKSKKPAFYHGHLAYIDFSRFGVKRRPLYINVIRKPIDRLVSYYYFLRNGDDFRPYLKRKRAGDKMTFDKCVELERSDCSPDMLWLQIPFFCGQAAECWRVGSKWALGRAKHNLVSNYLLVGLTEELGDFIAVLEAALPKMFAGATQLYTSGNKSHLRKTFYKLAPSEESISALQQSKTWRMENEFYEFTRDHFHFIRKRTFEMQQDGRMRERSQQFIYEKIRPK